MLYVYTPAVKTATSAATDPESGVRGWVRHWAGARWVRVGDPR
eukprot:COSAG02_NODE_65360_length_258_cov_0.654088_1_plen_42_part_01